MRAGRSLQPLDESGRSTAGAESLRPAAPRRVAICLMHAYANPAHELRLRELLLAALPGLVISLSHEVSPEAREFDRLWTTIANAYIQPLMASYLADFQARFSDEGLTCPILMMTAGGGMTTMETAARLPIRLVESGPAGGAILAARIAAETGEREVLSFDMGGTTAKLCLIDQYRPQTARKFEIARAARFIKGSGMPVRIPVIEMIEIGAGGGSIAHVDRLGRLQVGPESAGSEPGPAAFAKGGTEPTVTDADVMQGLIEPGRFAEGRLKIDMEAAKRALASGVGAGAGMLDAAAGRPWGQRDRRREHGRCGADACGGIGQGSGRAADDRLWRQWPLARHPGGPARAGRSHPDPARPRCRLGGRVPVRAGFFRDRPLALQHA